MLDSIKRFVNPTSSSKSTEELMSNIMKAPLPQHLAIIMDGNGRWAKKRGLPRTAGHAAGMIRVREVIRTVDELGIKVLTLYSFSTENWKRPKKEVEYLMKLPIQFLKTDLQELVDRNVRVQMLGELSAIPPSTRSALQKFVERTKNNTGLILNFAINYGARDEIMSAIHQLIDDVLSGKLKKDQLNESFFHQYLLTRGLPDPDLVIRTSGELRISNFLLWQIAYSELWFTDVLWPDFSKRLLCQAIEEFQKRSRRYGAVK